MKEYTAADKSITIKSEDGIIVFEDCDNADLIQVKIKNVDGDVAAMVLDKKYLLGVITIFKH